MGAVFDDIGSNVDQGSAYVFRNHAQQWVERQKLTASDGAPVDNFGISVSFWGATIVVGAPGGGDANQGSAYVFERHAQQWPEQQTLTASDGAPGDGFGRIVAITGSTIV